MKTIKNSLLVLTMFSALTSFAAGNGDTESAGQIANPIISDAIQALKGPLHAQPKPMKTKYVGVSAAKKGLQALLINIDQELQMARQSGNPDVFSAALISVSRKLVDFTVQTRPKDYFNNAEIEEMRGVDEFAEKIRMQILADGIANRL